MYDKKENLNNSCCLIVDNGLLETVCFRFYLFLPPFQLRKEFFHGGACFIDRVLYFRIFVESLLTSGNS